MIETIRGLPNTCSKCRAPRTREEGWYAEHVDAARAGRGLCPACAGQEESPKTTEPVEDDLTKLNGVGPARSEELARLGYTSFESLTAADPEQMAKDMEVSQSQIESWQEQAAELME